MDHAQEILPLKSRTPCNFWYTCARINLFIHYEFGKMLSLSPSSQWLCWNYYPLGNVTTIAYKIHNKIKVVLTQTPTENTNSANYNVYTKPSKYKKLLTTCFDFAPHAPMRSLSVCIFFPLRITTTWIDWAHKKRCELSYYYTIAI